MDSNFFSVSQQTLTLKGDWTLKNANELTHELKEFQPSKELTINPSELNKLDTVGAWLLLDWIDKAKQKITVEISKFDPNHILIFNRIKAIGPISIPAKPRKKAWHERFIESIGKGVTLFVKQSYQMLNFLGGVSISFVKTAVNPRTWRFAELARHIQETGFNAIPIVGMMGFLISIVIAYQGVFQLRKFGAEIFTIDLVAIAVLREMGVLITAIMVAGRSGSAFAAEIGVMKVNEELDALRTLGLSPITLLVLPRMMALIITLPLLTFLADMMGLIGAALLLMYLIGISFAGFADRVQEAIVFSTFATGLLKAPVFAGIIALVGCLSGMQVTNSAESVGKMTTKAVVKSIALVIVGDAIFSIYFTWLNI
jgi:phospholipid/cholesterol/gamma-HCH transport system permease protein